MAILTTDSSPTYLNLRANKTLCELYIQDMDMFGAKIQLDQEKMMNASTDMGNVSHIIPSFHGAFVIPAEKDVSSHNSAFAKCAATDEGHEAALNCAKGMAMLALRVLIDEDVAKRAKQDFEQDDE